MLRIFFVFIFIWIQIAHTADVHQDDQFLKSQERISKVTNFPLGSPCLDFPSLKRIAVLDGGFETEHHDFQGMFHDAYNPDASHIEGLDQVNLRIIDQNYAGNNHGTGVCGIIHQLSPSCHIVPICYHGRNPELVCKALKYAIKKADIVNLSITFSEGYMYKNIPSEVKNTLLEITKLDKLFILAAGNGYLELNSTPYLQDISDILKQTDENVLIFGATIASNHKKEELWKTCKSMAFDVDDKFKHIVGSVHPGDSEVLQKRFMVAPSQHYTSDAYDPEGYQKRSFGMTSSSAPVASAIAERLWSSSPEKSARDVGKAILTTCSFDHVSDSKKHCGCGMINYGRASEKLAQ